MSAQLISAGRAAAPLFVVSDTTKLRAYVNVPQNYVPSVKIGTKAQITVPEYPGRTFTATVEASAQSVDVASGTTRMLLVVDNASGALMTGAFANVRLELPNPRERDSCAGERADFRPEPACASPPSADDGKVALKTVTIARDLGREVEIATGLAAGRSRHREPAGRHRDRRSGARRQADGPGQCGGERAEAGEQEALSVLLPRMMESSCELYCERGAR